jgi:hypothetical protein
MALTPRDKRMLQILGVVGGLALAFFLFTNVLGGGGDEVDVAAPTGVTGVVPITGPTATPTPEASGTLPPVVLAGARDPFSTPPQLVTTAAPTDGVGTATSPPVDGTSTVTTAPTFPTTGSTTTISTSTTSTFSPSPTGTSTLTSSTSTSTSTSTSPGDGDGDGNPDEPTHKITIGEHNLRLVSVNQKQQRVEIFVDHKLWTVEEGGTFEEVYKLVKIQGKCARFLYGDDSFTLCLKS